MSIRTWKPYPLHMMIIELLESKGPMADIDMFNILKEDHEEIGFRTFNQTLMEMEIAGKVHVSSLTRGKRRVELVKKREKS